MGNETVPVVALIGAGASKASGDYGDGAPPLTRELFDTPRARQLLRDDKNARSARSALRAMMISADGDAETVAFETALRRLHEDGHAHHAIYAAAVPGFLRTLMLGYSRDLAAEQFRYDLLIDALLQLPTSVTFVSLNYDVLLDNHLDGLRPLTELGDYLPTGRGAAFVQLDGSTQTTVPSDRGGHWALIKPHGSIAWVYQRDAGNTRPRLHCLPIDDLAAETGRPRQKPALALPIGEKDELICPTSHLDYLRDELDKPWVDLLVLGYSGIDTEILTMIKEASCKIRRLTIANYNDEAALDVMRRFHEFGITATWPDIVTTTYASWIDEGGLLRWTHDFSRHFEHIVGPEQARSELVRRFAGEGRPDQIPDWLGQPIYELGLLRN